MIVYLTIPTNKALNHFSVKMSELFNVIAPFTEHTFLLSDLWE
ncbi:MAG: hypothetical protein QX196_09395 [Methylococcaceae bacterium]